MRRLRNDLAALERLRLESSVFRFSAQGEPPQQYHISFQGKGLYRERGKVKVLELHRVEIKLGASYPRTIPEIRWITPIYHPNISEIGMVCLGGYGTHWVPSVQLEELCVMLWDMARYHNYDIRSPYNRDAALWVANQTKFRFPTDARPMRDLRAALGRVDSSSQSGAGSPEGVSSALANGTRKHPESSRPENELRAQVAQFRQFIERCSRVFPMHASPVLTGPETGTAQLSSVAPAVIASGDPAGAEPNGDGVPLDALPSQLPLPERDPSNDGRALETASLDLPLLDSDPDDDDDGVIILESTTSLEPAAEAPRPGNDEIIFID
jgi:ubiquitin-protein ligase